MENKKVLMISPQDFIHKNNSGGLHGAGRNYVLLAKAFGSKNVSVLQIVDELHEGNVSFPRKQVLIRKGNLNKYYNMFFLRDRYSKRQEREIKQYINEMTPDIVFFDGTTFGRIAKMLPTSVMKIAFYHNIEKRYATQKKNLMCVIRFWSAWMNEKYITKRADVRICLNRRDDELLYKNYRVHSDYMIPVTFEDVGEESINKKMDNKRILLFVGSFFLPNVKGIKWFCRYVMPRIDMQLIVAGKGMERLRGQLDTHNVKVVGSVVDLSEYYNIASAVVMPIFVGDGMKVKTAEALMYGKTIFATNEALEGYDVEDVDGIYRCNTADEFVNAINYESEFQFRKDVRNVFLNHYCTETWENKFADFLTNKIEQWEGNNECGRKKTL